MTIYVLQHKSKVIMKLSESIKRKMKGWEGCRLTAYRCPAGVLTIGYGHTGADVTPGKNITQAQADALFDRDIEAFAASIAGIVTPTMLKQCQFDALVSIAYNIGVANFRTSTLLRLVKCNPEDPKIREAFGMWNKARVNGVLKPLPGLIRRRKEEADHYFGKS